jgi:PAS domain S-box-containing protein
MPVKDHTAPQPPPLPTNGDLARPAAMSAMMPDDERLLEQRWRIFEATLSAVSAFFYTFDREGRFLYVNQPLLDLWGLKLEDVTGKTFLELKYPEELAARLQGQVREVFATGLKVTGETEYTSPTGVQGHYEYFFCPVVNPGGAVELVAGLTIDVTRRKAVEKHLAQTEARYRGLLEAAPDGMVVVNQAGDIVLLNSRAERQFRYWRDELIGQKVKSIIPEGFAERLVADGTRTAAEALAQQIGTGIELTGRRKDGSEFPIEIMLSPLENAGGILVTAAIRDISVRKEAERHLVQMEGKYRGLLEAAPDGMVVVNQSGEIVLLNAQAEKQFGYQRDELQGQIVKSIIPHGFAERLIADGTRTAAEALAQQIGTGIELTGRRKDGSEFPIEIMLSPLDSAGGILVTAAIRDITIRKQAEADLVQKIDELNRSNEELEQFAYVASHDLQEPLRMVASYTQLLSRRYKGKLDSDADEFISFAVDGARRMQRLIQDLLSFSRVGKRGLELVDISSDRALKQALKNLTAVIEERGALVTHGPLPAVKADEVQLVQLFQNLVGNAIKYQGPGVPHVHVSAQRSGASKWTFSVQDSGLGISPEFFERIFGMFQRLHKRDEFEGTGMGLAICKKIVERHGGSIWVESTPGAGSTFHFTLAATDRKS